MEIKRSAVTQAQRWSWGRVASGMACLLLLLGGVAVQPAVAGGATEAMKSTIDEVLKIIQDKELKQPGRAEERRQRLEQVVGDRFDYQEMSRRALGAPWNTLSDKDKARICRTVQDALDQFLRRQDRNLFRRRCAVYQ